MNGETIRTITIRGQSEGLDKLTADINKLVTAEQSLAIVSEEAGKKHLSLEAAWKRQTLKLDEAARAQANIARETKLADAALREGLATQAQHAQRLELINQRYTTAASGAQTYGKTLQQGTGEVRLARHELINLSRQIQDVGVGIASGQSPFTILVQQGTQIADVFASSGGSLRGFFGQAFSWAKTFLTSTTGIVTGVLAIGGAIAYAAMKFTDVGKTIEEVLKEEQRLLKETKVLIDEKASAEAKAHAQSRAQTTFEVQRNLLQLQIKLNDAMRETADLVAKTATRPTQVAGEMGEAPTGISAAGMDPGFAEIAAARERLNAAIIAGNPGFVAFNEELAKIGQKHPELALTVEKLIAMNAEGVKLEQAAMRTKAMADALAGVATNAQLAAAGLAKSEAAATASKQEGIYKRQLAMYDQIRLAQGTVTKAQLAYERTLSESGSQRQAEWAKWATERLESIEREKQAEQEKHQAEQQAIQNRRQANQEAINAINEQNAYLAQQKAIYDEIVEQISFSVARMADFDPASGRITIQSFGSSQWWTDPSGRDTQFNPAGYESAPMGGAIDRAAEAVAYELATGLKQGEYKQVFRTEPSGMARSYPGIMDYYALEKSQFEITAAGRTAGLTRTIDGILGRSGSLMDAFNTTLTQAGSGIKEAVQPMQQLIELAPKEQQASMIQAAIAAVRAQPATLEREQLLKQLTDKMEGLASSTDALNATMQNALSPYYSQDPRTTKLGFRAGVKGNPDWLAAGASNVNPLAAILGPGATAPGMAGGGSFVVGGGYSSVDNKIAQFPVASGEQIVVNRRPGGQPTIINNDNRIVINGNLDQNAMSKLKISRFQQQQRMSRAASAA